jgi:AbrB family looped-hinge helix DNA binding protein
METVIDSMGRIVIPKRWRVAFGLTPGTKVEITPQNYGIQVVPGGKTAQLVQDEHGEWVARSDTTVTNDDFNALIDLGRR